MTEFFYRHYIRTDEAGQIIAGFSDAFQQPAEGDICFNERGGYQFRLFQGEEENPPLYNNNGIPMYKWYGEKIVKRTEKELADQLAAMQPTTTAPSAQEDTDAMLIDHEYRLTLLELGVTE